MVRHSGRVLERAAVLQVRSNTRRPERVIADLRADAGRDRAAPNHRIGIGLGQDGRAQSGGAALDRPEQWAPRVIGDADAIEIGVQIRFERVVK